ncbi:MAG: response regulator [Bacteroidetes bacterium]|nr:response regulator [Bacteroidota bacterium]
MQETKIKVLYVDDEANNLISFKANYRKFYDIHTAGSAEEARKILRSNDIHIIITDQLMPNTTGVQFLESIIEEHPYPMRMILSAYADIEAVIEAVNKGQIYKYIMKPFQAEELKKTIDNAYSHYAFRKNDKKLLDKYRKIFEESNEAFFIVDKEGYFTELNQAGFNLLKIPVNDLYSIRISELYRDENELNSTRYHFSKNNYVLDLPLKFRDMKNNPIEVLVSFNTIFDTKGQIIGHQGIIRDITKQKETENLVIRTIVETQESERTRIAKDIHDSIGQQLSAIKFYLSTLAETNEVFKNNLLLSKSTTALTSVLSDLRGICFNLMPNTIETFGLIETINQLCRQNQSEGLLEFKVNSQPDFPALNKLLEISIFRIVQEFISNAVKHGKATKISMLFEYESGKIRIMLKDNGKGFEIDKANSLTGMGLKNVYSRIQSYNGEIKINSTLQKGTEFIIFIPINTLLLAKEQIRIQNNK